MIIPYSVFEDIKNFKTKNKHRIDTKWTNLTCRLSTENLKSEEQNAA